MANQGVKYLCGDCNHRWTLTREEILALMRMTPVCPDCGSWDVRSVGLVAMKKEGEDG